MNGAKMKKIFLLRHAHAFSGSNDFERELNLEGIEKAKYLEKIFRDYLDEIDLVLCSSSVRTSTTARIALPNFPINYMRDLYNANSQKLLSCVNNIILNYNSIVLVGHNPGISELASTLSAKELFLKPGGLVLINSSAKNWSELLPSDCSFVNHWE